MYIKGRKDGRQKVKRWRESKRERVDFVLSSSTIFGGLCCKSCAIPFRRVAFISVILTAVTGRRFHLALSGALNVIELLGSWHRCLTRLPLPSSPSLSLSNDQHAGGRGESACLLALAASCAAWQWPSAL